MQPYIYGRVLDYGCEFGVLANMCDPSKYFGVDISEEFIRIARDNYPQFRFMTYVPDGERFDTIIALALIEHIPNAASLLMELRKMLKTKGKIVLTTPHPSVKYLYTFGSKIGLFSEHASQEHKQLINYRVMGKLAIEAGLIIEKYERFLFGLNQLFILKEL